MRNRQRPGQIGDYWPSRRPNSPAWCRTWFDPATRQTRRESLTTESFKEASELLAHWYAHNVVMKKASPADVRLLDVLERYWLEHAGERASVASINVHIHIASDLIDSGVTVSEFGPRAQTAFVARLRDRGHAPGYVKRIFTTIKAAVNWAWRSEIITTRPPFIIGPLGGEPRERVMTIEELARLWDAAEAQHLQAFIMVMICCMCRTKAALELTRPRCLGGLVDLNGNRQRTTKRRPTIPMPAPLQPWVSVSGFHLVEFNSRPIKSVKTIWKATRIRAGLGTDVIPMTATPWRPSWRRGAYHDGSEKASWVIMRTIRPVEITSILSPIS